MPESERIPLVETLRRERAELEGQEKVAYLRALLRPRVFLLAAVYFCFISGQMDSCFGYQCDGEFQETEQLFDRSSLYSPIHRWRCFSPDYLSPLGQCACAHSSSRRRHAARWILYPFRSNGAQGDAV